MTSERMITAYEYIESRNQRCFFRARAKQSEINGLWNIEATADFSPNITVENIEGDPNKIIEEIFRLWLKKVSETDSDEHG